MEEASFKDLNVDDLLIQQVLAEGITVPTTIQEKVVPKHLEGSDLIIEAETGSGKSLAFLLPILTKVIQDPKPFSAVIIAPTNELAMQLYSVAESLCQKTELVVHSYIGSGNKKRQLERLKKQKPHVVFGTPDRVLSLAEEKKLKLQQTQYVVIDEADQLLQDEKSQHTVTKISQRVGKEAQYALCSATFPTELARSLEKNIPDPLHIQAKTQIPLSIDHVWVESEKRKKIDTVRQLIATMDKQKGIVFTSTIEKAEETVDKLTYKKVKAVSLIGVSDKQDRKQAIDRFRGGEADVLVATELAARGLDIADVDYVINLDPPTSNTSYIHRAGRTGRVGRRGLVITLSDETQVDLIKKRSKGCGVSIEKRQLRHGKLQA
ncbi:DEAD/DEAH box helicase [Texcoconibacillus texcoconensis]|uniref:Superfamily II DNA/RNA helicase n=1 Tax=Texcoconibacillus texcoconensis TaxID=1095777 RepID=A0A840QNB1_9BACI|nr:DEAD/DEAH box helicase [Texcoconibacillus texcoconensis]MBB5172859.1 superfamily II DNA/RNA helicase [Texcoconibacillus texcoconensis]